MLLAVRYCNLECKMKNEQHPAEKTQLEPAFRLTKPKHHLHLFQYSWLRIGVCAHTHTHTLPLALPPSLTHSLSHSLTYSLARSLTQSASVRIRSVHTNVCIRVHAVYVCVCACTSLVHATRSSQLSFFLQGDGGPSNEALPCNPGKRTCIACAWAPLWAASGALTFVLLSSHFVLRHSFVSDVAKGCKGQKALPLTDHFISFCMPFLMSGMRGIKTSIS